MGMNHFKNSVKTCFVHNDTLDLLRNLQQVSYSARLCSIALFPIHLPSLYGSKAESRTVFLDMAVPRKQSYPHTTGNLTSTPTRFSYMSTYGTVISGWLVFRSRKRGYHQVVVGRVHNVTTNIMTNECNREMRNPSLPPCTISRGGEPAITNCKGKDLELVVGYTHTRRNWGKGKAIPVQALRVPGGWFHDSRHMKVIKFVNPMHQPPLPPRRYPWYSCVLEAESTPGP